MFHKIDTIVFIFKIIHDCYLVLRQGDPLSLMLFVIFIDVLDTLIQRVVKDGFLQCLTNHHIALSVSLFADDIVIFCHPDAQDHGMIHELLRVFLDVLHCADPMPACGDEAIGDGLSCPITNFPIPYLVLPLSVRQIPSSTLQVLVDRIEGKFNYYLTGRMSKRGKACAGPTCSQYHASAYPPGHGTKSVDFQED